MLRFTVAALAAIIGISLTGVLRDPPESLAHEVRAVGNYQFVVGFLNEPAYAYEPSGLELEVAFFPNGVPEGESEEEGQPVEGLEETLQAEVIVGGGAETLPLTIEAAFGSPGAYDSPLIFTVPGDYTFRIFGEIDGQQIDESFDSGPETFGPMGDPQEIQFPEVLAAPPVEGTDTGAEPTSSDSSSSSSDDTARILGIVGIIVGVVGLGAGVVVLATRRS
jgi:hypothetical protein